MAQLTSQLEAAEQRLKDLDRQRQRLEEDHQEADRLTPEIPPMPSPGWNAIWRAGKRPCKPTSAAAR